VVILTLQGASIMGEGLLRLMAGMALGWVLLGVQSRAEEAAPAKPPWQRLLQGEDARKAQMLEGRLQELQEAGKFEAALHVAEELAALRTRVPVLPVCASVLLGRLRPHR
jgi:hypothetical protein